MQYGHGRDQRPESLKGREMLLGGIVTDFREGMTKTGKPYGVVKIEDFTGSGEIALFGNNYIEYSKYLQNPVCTCSSQPA